MAVLGTEEENRRQQAFVDVKGSKGVNLILIRQMWFTNRRPNLINPNPSHLLQYFFLQFIKGRNSHIRTV